MNVPQFLYEAVVTANIVIVIASLPEGSDGQRQGRPCDGNLKALNGSRQRRVFWLGDQKVNVLRHDDVSEDS